MTVRCTSPEKNHRNSSTVVNHGILNKTCDMSKACELSTIPEDNDIADKSERCDRGLMTVPRWYGFCPIFLVHPKKYSLPRGGTLI